MKRRILYIPGLGDGYDPIRRLGLLTWRRRNTTVELVPMRWSDPDESFEQKLARIEQAISRSEVPVTIVGESAGGAVALTATDRFRGRVAATITICGMNHDAEDVNPRLYRRNSAFRDAMEHSDKVVATLTKKDKATMSIVYSSKDFTVRPKNTMITGVSSVDLKTIGHMTTILYVLYLRSSMMISRL